jgi:hypothetical protein
MTTPLLPLTVFEELLFWENRPAFPCSCFARLQLAGRIDRQAFEAAVRTVMPRHPLLAARVEARGRRLFWAQQPHALPEIRWLSGPTRRSLPATTYQDLRNEIGLRLLVVENGDSCDITAQFHHACCDGVGIQALLSDILVAYALAKGAHSNRLRLPNLEPDRLARRGAYGLSFMKLAGMLPRQVIGLPGAAHFFARSPSPVLPHQPPNDDDAAPEGHPATRTHVFSEDETTSLNKAASRLDVTVNDLLARDLYLALGQWRAQQGAGNDDEWMRVMIPMNLRSTQDKLLPAANMVGAVFLDRRGRDFGDARQLLAGIARELRLIRENRLGLIFIYALHVLGLFPSGLRSIARRGTCMTSSIFSNLGRPLLRCPLPRDGGLLIAGNLVLERTDGAVPLPPFACTTATVMEYARRLSVTLHYDPRCVTASQADDLAAAFVHHVRATGDRPA